MACCGSVQQGTKTLDAVSWISPKSLRGSWLLSSTGVSAGRVCVCVLWDLRDPEAPPNQKLLWGPPSGAFVTEKGSGTECRVASGCSAEQGGGRVESGQRLGRELPAATGDRQLRR